MKSLMLKQRSTTKTINHTPILRRLGSLVLSALCTHKTWVGALAAMILASQASASVYFFSTGSPDGKIATLTRPATGGSIQTETADDFDVAQTTLISAATFTG